MTDTPEPGPYRDTPEDIPLTATPRFPWPPPEQEPVFAGFAETWRRATFAPTSFFRAMPRAHSLGAALLFYLIIGLIAAGIQLFWSFVLPDPGFLDLPMEGDSLSPLVEFLLSPLVLLAGLYIAAAVTHLMVLMLVPRNTGFGGTLRVLAYSYSPAVFVVVPYLGVAISVVWRIVLTIIGLRETHHTSTARAAVAVFVPVVIALLLILVASLLLVAAGAVMLPAR